MRVSFSPAPPEPVTTTREIWSWYSYAFASEAYVVALTNFIPITLAELAYEQGHLYGTNQPCKPSANSTSTIVGEPIPEKPRCMISFGSLEVDTASFVLYLTSLAVLLQALTVVSVGALADHGSWRKKQLVVLSVCGSVATMLIFAAPHVLLAGALSVTANVCFGVGFVSFNAFLPLLVRNVEHLRTRRQQLDQLQKELEDPRVAQDEAYSNDRLHDASDDDNGEQRQVQEERSMDERRKMYTELSEQLNEDKSQLMGYISARGFAAGYLGGVLLLVLCLYISYRSKSSTQSLKVGIFLSGLWWFIFAALAGLWLKPRPGSDLILEEQENKRGKLWKMSQYILYSWGRVGRTIAQARKLPSAFAFLISWFFLSDGYTSITNVAILFAKTSLGLPQTQLILLSLVVPICALIGALAFPKIQTMLRFDQKQMVLLLLFLLLFVPLYGALGLILPFWGHLTTATELFIGAVYFGSLIGAVQSYCRSLFASLVPRGRESEFFGLYAITDKGSSWLGPLVIALITDATHEIRHSFIFLLVLLSLPIPIVYFGVNVEQGRIDAEQAAQEAGDVGAHATEDESERLLPSM
ncbi:Autophagy protein 22 [Podila minutissima]|nr:Autophagy protein 22 [Podila minutissima]